VGRPARTDVRNEFAYWLATPKRLRVSLGLPQTEVQFAEMKGMHPRSIRRWKTDPDFMELVEQQKILILNESPNSTINKVGPARPVQDPRSKAKIAPPAPVTMADDPALEPGLTPDEQKYLQVKDTLVRMAMDGNQGAMDLYLKHYGKSFVEAERQDYRDYEEFSDERLASEVLNWVGVERVSAWLAAQADTDQ
jgi:hypothetical protein